MKHFYFLLGYAVESSKIWHFVSHISRFNLPFSDILGSISIHWGPYSVPAWVSSINGRLLRVAQLVYLIRDLRLRMRNGTSA